MIKYLHTTATLNPKTKDPVVPQNSLFYFVSMFRILVTLLLTCFQSFSPNIDDNKGADTQIKIGVIESKWKNS